ncbi:MAG TPA: alpha/beta hydrolase [Intrasporangium sp.]|nr:alpha/beta hydrolase [Intrasporangium sp.]
MLRELEEHGVDAYPGSAPPRVPTLIIHFRDDTGAPFAGAQTLAQRIPHAETLFLDHGGHLGLGHHPEVETTLHRFLHEVVTSR